MINVYTEEDAKKKVCCQAIHLLGMKPLVNCMAGSCMAWRGTIDMESIKLPEGGWELKTTSTGEGFCGLAGKPNV